MKASAKARSAALRFAAFAVWLGGGISITAQPASPFRAGFVSQSPSSSAKSQPASPPAKAAAPQKTPAKKPVRRRRPAVQSSPTPERIKEIQAALAKAGYYSAEPSGKLDMPTQDALKRFQTDNSLSVTGKLSALTLQTLGLGSDIAGVAPPRLH